VPSGFGLNPVSATETFQQQAARTSQGKATGPGHTFPVKTGLFSPQLPNLIIPKRYKENTRLLGFL